MKDLIYSLAALILGFILGVVTVVLAAVGLGAYVYLDEAEKKRAKTGYTRPSRKTRYTGPTPTTGTDETPVATSDPRQKVLEHFILTNRRDAEKVVDGIKGILRNHGTVSVADLYDLVGVRSKDTDIDWGWTKFPPNWLFVRQVRHGYELILPALELL